MPAHSHLRIRFFELLMCTYKAHMFPFNLCVVSITWSFQLLIPFSIDISATSDFFPIIKIVAVKILINSSYIYAMRFSGVPLEAELMAYFNFNFIRHGQITLQSSLMNSHIHQQCMIISTFPYLTNIWYFRL